MRTLTAILLISLLSCAGRSPTVEPEPAPTQSSGGLDHGKELGKQFLKTALKEYTFVKDPEVIRLVNRVGREIVQAVGEDPSTYHFLVVKQNQLNAFAIPGGYIFLFDGLLKKFASIDDLAGVMAHEIAHVQLNHFFKDAKKIDAINLATMASIILAGLAGEGQGAAGAIALGANVSLQLKFSRKNEEEADLHAIRFLRQTQYNPIGLSNFFSTLAFYQRFTQGTAPSYLSTHPGVQDRQFMVETLVKDLPIKKRAQDSPDFDWNRIVTILRAGAGRGTEGRTLETEKESDPSDEERRLYLTGLSFFKSGALQEAFQAYRAAIVLNPNQSLYYADLSKIYMQLQEADLAKEAALKSIELSNDNATPHLVLGMIALAEENHTLAVSHLEDAKDRNPENPMIHFQLARSYHSLSKRGLERFHIGRYHRLNLEPEKAMIEFQKALDLMEKESLLAQTIQGEIEEITREGL